MLLERGRNSKSSNFHSPLEESNISGLKRVRRNRCIQAVLLFLKKKKKSLLNIVNLKNCSSRYNLKPKLKHVDNRNELKNNKAISKRCQGLEFRSLDPVGKSGRAIFRNNNRETVITKEKGETDALLVIISTMDVKTRGSYWRILFSFFFAFSFHSRRSFRLKK